MIKKLNKKVPPFETSGIYKLKYNTFYIGNTSKNIKKRYKEHISEIKYNKGCPYFKFC